MESTDFSLFYPSTQLRKKMMLMAAMPVLFLMLLILLPFASLVLLDLARNRPVDSWVLGFLLIIGGGLLSLLLLTQGFYWYYFKTIKYELQENEIHVYRGLITKSHKIVPFRTITNMDLRRGVFDRLLGIGTVEIQTAGGSVPMRPEERIDGMLEREMEPLREYILGKVRQFVSGGAGTSLDAEKVSDVEVLSGILDELKQLRMYLVDRK